MLVTPLAPLCLYIDILPHLRYSVNGSTFVFFGISTMGQFADNLKRLRADAKLTQAKLADRAGLSLTGITDLEQGRREPSWSTVQSLCTALGVDCTAFDEAVKPAKKPKKAK